jgi:hypothetical protein
MFLNCRQLACSLPRSGYRNRPVLLLPLGNRLTKGRRLTPKSRGASPHRWRAIRRTGTSVSLVSFLISALARENFSCNSWAADCSMNQVTTKHRLLHLTRYSALTTRGKCMAGSCRSGRVPFSLEAFDLQFDSTRIQARHFLCCAADFGNALEPVHKLSGSFE